MVIIVQPRRLLNFKHGGSQSKGSSTTTHFRHVSGERSWDLGIKDLAGLCSSTTMSRNLSRHVGEFQRRDVRAAKSPEQV